MDVDADAKAMAEDATLFSWYSSFAAAAVAVFWVAADVANITTAAAAVSLAAADATG